jgi:predicted dehydrogenase
MPANPSVYQFARQREIPSFLKEHAGQAPNRETGDGITQDNVGGIAMDLVRIGVIGCGGMARDLARRCVNMERTRIVAVYDLEEEALTAAASEFGAEQETNFEALCGRADVDAVIVGSPPGAHMDNVLAAAAHKKPVYCEKPLAVNVAQCDRMIHACEKAGVSLFVGQVLRLFPLFWQSRVLIDEGKIGAPRAVSVTRAGYGEIFHKGWRTRRADAGGLLLEVNAHEFDYMRFLLGEPKEVYARLENILSRMEYEDQGFVLVTFENGAAGCLHTTFSSPIGEYRVHIQGTGGNMVHGGFGGSLQYRTLAGESAEIRPADVNVPNPYDRELSSWLDSLTVGAKPLFTGADGRAAVAMAEAAYRSAEENRPVALSEL